uniref:CARD domain-containing protein n=1 Tax=Syphacia muris TaxID=451379 RepID=A0A0N5AKD1_9BILA
MLLENDCKALAVSMEALLRDFEPTEALPYMEAADIFNDDHVEALTKLNRRTLRVQQFLRIYRQKADNLEPLIKFFVDNKQSHLASLIEKNRNIKVDDRPIPSEDRLIMRLLESGIPVQCKNHVNREELLVSLKDTLINLASEDHFWLVIHGMPGCGKSCLAADIFSNYPELFRYYENVYWISGDSCKTVDALPSFYGNFSTIISDAIMLTGKEQPENLNAQVRLALLEKPNSLFILDNIIFEECVRWFDQLRCRILVTSRNVDIFQASNAKVVLFPMTATRSGFTLKEMSDFFSETHPVNDCTVFKEKSDLYERVHLVTCGLPALVNIMSVLSRNSLERLYWLCVKMDLHTIQALDCITCYRYSNLARAFNDSFNLLRETEKHVLLSIALFPPNTWVPVQVIDFMAPIDVCGSRETIFETLQVLETLAKRSMIEERQFIDGDGCPYEYLIHPLTANFLCTFINNEFLKGRNLLISRIESYLNSAKPRIGYQRVKKFYETMKPRLIDDSIGFYHGFTSRDNSDKTEIYLNYSDLDFKPCSLL